MTRYGVLGKTRQLLISQKAHASNADIWEKKDWLSALPKGFTVDQLYLYADLSVTAGVTGQVLADAVVRSIGALTMELGTQLIRVNAISGEELAQHARILPPTGKFFPFNVHGDDPPGSSGTEQVRIAVPLLYSDPYARMGERFGYNTEILKHLQFAMKTQADSSIGDDISSITGTWYLCGNLSSTRALILPPPLELFRQQVTDEIKFSKKKRLRYLMSYVTSGNSFTLTQRDSLKIDAEEWFAQGDTLGRLQAARFAFESGGEVDWRATTGTRHGVNDSAFNLDDQVHYISPACDLGESPKQKSNIILIPAATRNVMAMIYTPFEKAILDDYSEVLGRSISGGEHVGPTPNEYFPYDPERPSILPLDVG